MQSTGELLGSVWLGETSIVSKFQFDTIMNITANEQTHINVI